MQAARILVVDDDESVRAVLSEMLESMGHNVVVAPGARAAVEAARMAGFDIVLIDIQMPQYDGLETLSMLQEVTVQPHYVMISGGANRAIEDACLQRGAHECIRKPLGIETLESLIARLLGEPGSA